MTSSHHSILTVADFDLPDRITRCRGCLLTPTDCYGEQFASLANRQDIIIKLRCLNCSTVKAWYCCTVHRLKFSSRAVALDHVRSQHNSFVLPASSTALTLSARHHELDDIVGQGYDLDQADDSQFSDSLSVALDPSDFVASSLPQAAIRYYIDEAEELGLGLRRIVGRAFSRDMHSTSIPTIDEAMYHLDVANLVLSLHGRQMNDFIKVMQGTVLALASTSITEHSQSSLLTVTRVPTSISDINNIYIAGAVSIARNLPQPIPEEYHGHAYISLRQRIELFYAQGLLTDHISLGTPLPNGGTNQTSPIMSYSQTIDAQNLKADAERRLGDDADGVILLYLHLWSDDFEGSRLKNNQQSVWVLTVTICPPPGKSSSTDYTFAVALGRKGQDHNPVMRRFYEELNTLRSPTAMYCSRTNTFDRVVVEASAFLADKPERAGLSSTISHKGTFAKMSSSSMIANMDTLPSCA
mmetsp:Transcript_24279/g.52903  ORF Transcript_24279/g.52903 Transcript_24279/m.52903 type:complete len:469 (+) Transcript_24279:2812-4218(+)